VSLVVLADAYVVEDTGGKLWIPLSEIPEDFRNPRRISYRSENTSSM
jgi:hypothetical protein